MGKTFVDIDFSHEFRDFILLQAFQTYLLDSDSLSRAKV